MRNSQKLVFFGLFLIPSSEHLWFASKKYNESEAQGTLIFISRGAAHIFHEISPQWTTQRMLCVVHEIFISLPGSSSRIMLHSIKFEKRNQSFNRKNIAEYWEFSVLSFPFFPSLCRERNTKILLFSLVLHSSLSIDEIGIDLSCSSIAYLAHTEKHWLRFEEPIKSSPKKNGEIDKRRREKKSQGKNYSTFTEVEVDFMIDWKSNILTDSSVPMGWAMCCVDFFLGDFLCQCELVDF